MAVVFTQTPTTPNGSQSTIVYGLSNLQSAPQAKYICDIYESGSVNYLVRLKQPANNNGYGVFEISDILHDYIDYDEIWTTEAIVKSSNNTKTYEIKFGEEYGTSISSSLSVFTNQVTDELTIYPAVTEKIDGLNWDSGSYYTDYLSNSPSILYARPEDYMTLSHMNILGSNPTSVTITVYNDSGSIAVKTFNNNFNVNKQDEKLIHIPAGPQNFKNDATLSILTGTSWSYYTITSNTNLGTKTIYKLDNCIEENGTQFAFINKLGVYDYYTAELTNTEQENYTQDTYEQTFVDYSTQDGTIPFTQSRRGTTVYNKNIESQFTAQTDWLTTEQSNWLVELFESPSVYVQYNDGFIPVVITNTNIQKKTNPRGQKLFTYTIEYKYANQKRSRR